MSKRIRLRRLLMEVGIGLIVGTVLSLLLWSNWLAGWQRRSTDFLYGKATAPVSGRVVIVAVDDHSLEELGRWEDWPRRRHAELIDILYGAGARVIAVDLLLPERSQDDETLAAAMVRADNVVLPLVGVVKAPRKELRGEPTTVDSFLKPQPLLAEAARGLGHVNAHPDPDSIIRRLPVVITCRETGEQALSFPLAVVARFLRLPAVDYRPQNGFMNLAGRHIPVDDFGQIFVNYMGPPSRPGVDSTFRPYSYVDVLKGRANPALFRDKIVLVGVMASAMLDSYPTPMGGEKMFGTEIYANVIESVLGGYSLHEQSLWAQLALVLGLAVAGAMVFSRLHVLTASVLFLFGLGLYGLIVVVAFQQGLILNVLYPALAWASVYVVVVIFRYVTESRQRRHITALFGRFISPGVVQTVLRSFDAGALRLGGDSREATVLFADIRGFTKLAEGQSPGVVMTTLNTYLTAMVQVVDRYEGTVNKFIGDSIMAIWNAPLDQPDHAWRAVQSACEMQRTAEQIATLEAEVLPVSFGIGINSGEMVAGNVGSVDRMEYTVIGAAVNLASRLCDQARPGEILIGPRTYELLGGKVIAQAGRVVPFKSERGPLPAYRVDRDTHSTAFSLTFLAPSDSQESTTESAGNAEGTASGQ